MKPVPKAYLILHDWNQQINQVVKLSKAEAMEYCAKWHGVLIPLYSEEQLVQFIQLEVTEPCSVKQLGVSKVSAAPDGDLGVECAWNVQNDALGG